ncbi:hypothetical protein K440DRAFT_662643 [Wilcoxina mikolae CBS 423.85]|nr:hypothetical protein K440DRAFT_662643 [Wilcoxina mikolae CBS 423.85]
MRRKFQEEISQEKVAEDVVDLKTRLVVIEVEEKGLRDRLEELRRAKEHGEERERLAREKLRSAREQGEKRERLAREKLGREKERWEVRELDMQSQFAERERKLWDGKYQFQRQLQYLEARWNESDQLHVIRSATRAANCQVTLDDDNTTDHQTLPLAGTGDLSPEDQLIIEHLLRLPPKTEIAMHQPACAVLRKLYGDSAPHPEDPKIDANYTPEEEDAILEFEALPANPVHMASVFHTHKLHFLGGHAPDITISLKSQG